MNRKTLILRNAARSLLLAGLLGASLTAQASDSLAQRVATGVGRVIATQGNAALVEIREEFKDRLPELLREAIKPAAPASPTPAATTGAGHTPGIALE